MTVHCTASHTQSSHKVGQKISPSFIGFSGAINLLFCRVSQQKVIVIIVIWGRNILEHFCTPETTSGNIILFATICPWGCTEFPNNSEFPGFRKFPELGLWPCLYINTPKWTWLITGGGLCWKKLGVDQPQILQAWGHRRFPCKFTDLKDFPSILFFPYYLPLPFPITSSMLSQLGTKTAIMEAKSTGIAPPRSTQPGHPCV